MNINEADKQIAVFCRSSFDILNKQARELYGNSPVRPQDEDPGMLRFMRRSNMDIIQPFPEGYQEQLVDWISNIPNIQDQTVSPWSAEMVYFQDAQNQSLDVIRTIRPPTGSFGVLAVDFMQHNVLSFDGN